MAFGDRKASLRSDPAKTRRWQDRSRGGLKRGAQAVPVAPLKAVRRKQQVRVPPKARQEVYARSAWACVVCAWRAGFTAADMDDPARWKALRDLVQRGRVGKATTLHHVLPKQRWPAFAKVAAIMVGACRQCHGDHEFKPGGRMPRAVIPAQTMRWIEETGPAAVEYVKRTYPH